LVSVDRVTIPLRDDLKALLSEIAEAERRPLRDQVVVALDEWAALWWLRTRAVQRQTNPPEKPATAAA
jgi:predicted transcriptional regulator